VSTLNIKRRAIVAALEALREAIGDLEEDAVRDGALAFHLWQTRKTLADLEEGLEAGLLAFLKRQARKEALPAPEPPEIPQFVVTAALMRLTAEMLESAPTREEAARLLREAAVATREGWLSAHFRACAEEVLTMDRAASIPAVAAAAKRIIDAYEQAGGVLPGLEWNGRR
jgi:hypothetical protein